MTDNEKLLTTSIQILDTIVERVDGLHDMFEKMQKRIDILEEAQANVLTRSKVMSPSRGGETPSWQEIMDEKIAHVTDKLKNRKSENE